MCKATFKVQYKTRKKDNGGNAHVAESSLKQDTLADNMLGSGVEFRDR
jgi:hypothetical protein